MTDIRYGISTDLVSHLSNAFNIRRICKPESCAKSTLRDIGSKLLDKLRPLTGKHEFHNERSWYPLPRAGGKCYIRRSMGVTKKNVLMHYVHQGLDC